MEQVDKGSEMEVAAINIQKKVRGSLSHKDSTSLVSALQGFQGLSAMRKLTFEVAALSLSGEQVSTLHHLFVTLDADGSGSLSFAEITAALRASPALAGLSADDLHAAFAAADINHSDRLDYHEVGRLARSLSLFLGDEA